jgi:hypothetical protein
MMHQRRLRWWPNTPLELTPLRGHKIDAFLQAGGA